MENNSIADRLRALRSEKGVNQETVAEAVGISRVGLARYETGQRIPVLKIAARLADYYGVSVPHLLGNDEPVPVIEKAPADDPLTEQIMAKARTMNEEELRQLLRIMDAVKK
jgi:transcriptional regulator with XRE-family HTH domain